MKGDGLNCARFNADFRPSPRPLIPKIMPTYDYSCQKCGQNFEAFQSMRNEPFRECPKNLCRLPKWGRGKVKRLLGTGAGLIFKGSGFYITDYRSDSYKEAAKKETPSTSTAAEKSTTPKETGGKAVATTSTKTPEKKSPKEPSE
jgi:putative FmdB family regulatory protein